ncbi:hypothetical protein [Sulfurimonas sp. HSL3-2]|uniref:hypothetical protein n=1 Tax=Hydrocurvibacter mobilis TaxID=3131936 RepID=UPI0031F76AC7
MTIDINVKETTEEFLDDIDEIIEDTMIQMFFLQPKDAAALEKAKADAQEYSAIFYAAPLSLKDSVDVNCVGFSIKESEELQDQPSLDKPLFIEESDLNDRMLAQLITRGDKGFVLNATHAHEGLENFFVAIGPANVGEFDPEVLSSLSMDKIVLQSSYPDHDFEEIFSTVKTLSDALLRPEQSIIARATKHTLNLSGFKKNG